MFLTMCSGVWILWDESGNLWNCTVFFYNLWHWMILSDKLYLGIHVFWENKLCQYEQLLFEYTNILLINNSNGEKRLHGSIFLLSRLFHKYPCHPYMKKEKYCQFRLTYASPTNLELGLGSLFTLWMKQWLKIWNRLKQDQNGIRQMLKAHKDKDGEYQLLDGLNNHKQRPPVWKQHQLYHRY